MTGGASDSWSARLGWVLKHSPDVAIAELGDRSFLYRSRQLVVPTADLQAVLATAEPKVQAVEILPVDGFTGLRLTECADPVALSQELAHLYGRPVAAPNHVLCGEAFDPGGVPGFPVPVPPLQPPRPPLAGSVQARVAVLDTGWAPHPWLDDRHWAAAVDPVDADDLAGLHELEQGGLTGHGLFAAGLVLQVCPDAEIFFRRVLDSAGVCDEVQLAAALTRLGRDPSAVPDVVLICSGGYTVDDLLPPILESALARLPSSTSVVAAAGSGGSDRPFWPAAAESVLAVGALARDGGAAGFSNRGPWVDAVAEGVDVESAFPVVAPALHLEVEFDGHVRCSGTWCAAAAVAGEIAARVAATGRPAPQVAGVMLEGAPRVPELGPAACRVTTSLAGPVVPSPPLDIRTHRRIRVPLRRRWPRWRRHPVSLGFARVATPEKPLGRTQALEMATDYVYWFEIGDLPLGGAMATNTSRVPPPHQTLAATPLTVALYGFAGELEVDRAAAVGEFVVGADGSLAVARQPSSLGNRLGSGRRLFFPVRTPDRAGLYRLRCNLYHRQTLLQSCLVEVWVGPRRWPRRRASRSTVDYAVTGRLESTALATIAPLRLSAFLDDNGDGSQRFRLFAEHGLRGETTLDPAVLQDDIDRARRALRAVAWGAEAQRQVGGAHTTPAARERLVADLIRLAHAGYHLQTHVTGPLAGPAGPRLRGDRSPVSSQDFMRRPGAVELPCKHPAQTVVPAALFYDFPLNPHLDLTVCADALAAVEAGGEGGLAAHRCFQGECAHYDDDSVVCPGGFWGFRHAVGSPRSIATPRGRAFDLAQEIRCGDRPHILIGAATDPLLGTLGAHLDRVRAFGSARSSLSQEHGSLVRLLRARPFGNHIVYFYCHGVLADGTPALAIGPRGSPGITPELIADGTMYWPATRPLVVLNGSGTTALEPQHELGILDAFVQEAGASGVIGTEITISESAAAAFAEEFFARFVDRHQPLGEAVRCARLALLAEGNPLGLVYIVYGPPQLRLVT